ANSRTVRIVAAYLAQGIQSATSPLVESHAAPVREQILDELAVQNAGSPLPQVVHVVGWTKRPIPTGPLSRLHLNSGTPELSCQFGAVIIHGGPQRDLEPCRKRCSVRLAAVFVAGRLDQLVPPGQPHERRCHQVRRASLRAEQGRYEPPSALEPEGRLCVVGLSGREICRGLMIECQINDSRFVASRALRTVVNALRQPGTLYPLRLEIERYEQLPQRVPRGSLEAGVDLDADGNG